MRATPDERSSSGSWVEELDGLRALACLAVFGVHFQQMTHAGGRLGPFDIEWLLENGNTGVCLFFVLTGFLLSLPFWKAARDSAADPAARPGWLRGYLRSRAARIVPPYYLCLAALIAAGGNWRGAKFPVDVLLHLAFLHNAAEFSIYGIASHFWALAVIVQFYVIFPLLILPLRRVLRFGAVACLVLAAAGTGAYLAHASLLHAARLHAHQWPLPPELVSPDGYVLTHSLLAHLPHFLLGMLAAGVFGAVRRNRAKKARVPVFGTAFWLAAGALVLILGIPELDDVFAVPFGRYNLPYVPILIAVLIVCAPCSRSASAVLAFAPVRRLGTISYGVYIYHPPCLALVASGMGTARLSARENWALFGAAGLIFSVAVATVSYVLMERPILRWAKRARADKGGGVP